MLIVFIGLFIENRAMNYPSTCADLQKRNIRKTILHAGVGDLPAFVDGGKVLYLFFFLLVCFTCYNFN